MNDLAPSEYTESVGRDQRFRGLSLSTKGNALGIYVEVPWSVVTFFTSVGFELCEGL